MRVDSKVNLSFWCFFNRSDSRIKSRVESSVNRVVGRWSHVGLGRCSQKEIQHRDVACLVGKGHVPLNWYYKEANALRLFKPSTGHNKLRPFGGFLR